MVDKAFAEDSTVKISFKATNVNSYIAKTLSLTNKARREKGLPALRYNSYLSARANKRARECVIMFSHTRPNGESCFSVGQGDNTFLAENIAVGQSSPQSVMDSWLTSEGHRANIENPQAKTIGIACVKYKGEYYWVQYFGNKGKTTSPPSKDVTKYQSIYAKESNLNLKMTLNKDRTRAYVKHKDESLVDWLPDVTLGASNFKWSSSNTDVATVKKGKISKVGGGQAYIRARIGNLKKSRKVKFSGKPVKTILKKKVHRGTTYKLPSPNKKKRSSFKWSSGNKKKVRVNSSGQIEAKCPGATYVYANSSKVKYRYRIRVAPKPVSKFRISKSGNNAIIRWKPAYGSSGVIIYRAIKSNGKYNFKSWKAITNTDKTSQKAYLEEGKKYAFKVYSYKYMDGARRRGKAPKAKYVSR